MHHRRRAAAAVAADLKQPMNSTGSNHRERPGPAGPGASNETEEGRAKNRRVELSIHLMIVCTIHNASADGCARRSVLRLGTV